MFWSKRKEIVKLATNPVFSDKEKKWIGSTVNNPIFDKVIFGMLLEKIDEENGLHKRSLSAEEYAKVLEWNNIYKTILQELKADMVTYSTKEEPEEEEIEHNLSYVPGLKE